MKRYYFTSILIHIVLLALIIIRGAPGGSEPNGDGEGGHSREKLYDKILPPPVDKSVELTFDGYDDIAAKKKKRLEDCKTWYGGIGILQNLFGEIQEVFPDYAADKVGLQPGDLITAQSEMEIKGEPGSTITLTITKKDGRVLIVPIVREKICYENT